MDAQYILKAMLDNEDLMEKHKYGPRDIKDIQFEPPHDNGFIQFMQSAVKIMDETQDETPRIMANRLIKFFEENYAL
ncbi:MAG: hypothetical protein ACE362_02315 [Phaeodactylibacter xiamenensis]|jgi:hypothetical protein|uniref:Uncharacterized protein n=1 Tax=Phaeodactylibacter xiamenensis TaxID=1524460 RepID=A0A098S9N6_9BACT|nr:hypothetical protein [Phaeodactylibacter xiamenensis]KGE88811.1 hypothetical protein IX84_06670 [Phaeodactylibacter xiamenensis]MCR9053524.1 hypothetical protein [bacterium]